MASTASGVQTKKPWAGEATTSTACGAVHVILRATSREGPTYPLSAR